MSRRQKMASMLACLLFSLAMFLVTLPESVEFIRMTGGQYCWVYSSPTAYIVSFASRACFLHSSSALFAGWIHANDAGLSTPPAPRQSLHWFFFACSTAVSNKPALNAGTPSKVDRTAERWRGHSL
jgi:hypothetical protein